MKINSFAFSNYQTFKSNLKNKQVSTDSFKTFAVDNPIYQLKAEDLTSRFDISFHSLKDDDVNVSAKRLENKIDLRINPKEYSPKIMKSGLKTNTDVQLANLMLKADGITEFYPTGIGLNRVFMYLQRKRQLNLSPVFFDTEKKSALFIDRLTVEYLENLFKTDFLASYKMLDELKEGKIKFYSLNVDSAELEQLKARLEKLFKSEIEIKKINNISAKETKMPNSNDIMDILSKMAEDSKLTKDEEKLFYKAALKYLDKTICCYSYQSLAQKMKEAYSKIEKYVTSIGKTMDDVCYFVPIQNKSHEVMNYLYASENNISQDSFIIDRATLDKRSKDKICVMLDDCALSGSSMLEDMQVFDLTMSYNAQKKELIFCPVITSSYAKELAEKFAQKGSLTYIPMEECKIYDILDGKSAMLDDGFSKEEIEILEKVVKSGFSEKYASIIFPYMIPDNSSELVAKLGSKFLVENNTSANKAALFQMKH